MKKLLTYLIPILIVAVAAIGESPKSDYTTSADPSGEVICESVSCFYELPSSIPIFYLPPQTPCTGNTFQSGVNKRTNLSCSFARTHKVGSSNFGNSIHTEYLVNAHLFTKSAHLFISLGKLII